MKAYSENEKKRLRRNYVLNRLAEDEKYRYEEICFDDVSEMVLLEEEREEVIDDYLTSTLGPDEKRSFESSFLSSPANLEDVALAKANRKLINEKSISDFDARVGLASFATEPTFWKRVFKKQPESAVTKDVKQTSWWRFFPDYFGSSFRGMAMAVALLIVAGGSYVWFRFATPLTISEGPSELATSDSRLSNQNAYNQYPVPVPTSSTDSIRQQNTNQYAPSVKKPSSPSAIKPQTSKPSNSVTAFVLTPIVRDEEAKPLEISKSTRSVQFRIKRPPADFRSYRVTLSTVEGQEVWSRKLTAKANEQLKQHINVTVPAMILSNQDFILDLSGVGSDGELENVGKYSFRVVKNR